MTAMARRGRGEQVANAADWFPDLTPVGPAAETTRLNWRALLPGQPVPLIGEDILDGHEEDRYPRVRLPEPRQ